MLFHALEGKACWTEKSRTLYGESSNLYCMKPEYESIADRLRVIRNELEITSLESFGKPLGITKSAASQGFPEKQSRRRKNYSQSRIATDTGRAGFSLANRQKKVWI